MDHHQRHVITLVNSIIGVSILAMPYCFKQCGVVLAFLILLVSNLLTRVTCHFLIKSANVTRRRTFEFLAFHVFGSLGKFGIEVAMIGFLIGTCIAFFVVMGDLGPEIISEITHTQMSSTMRMSMLMAMALFCVLPLGLLRNVDSLIGVSKATIGFYVCLVVGIMFEALPHLFRGDWINKVELWRPSGVLQVLPIVSMALFCQTQLFEIYQALEHPTLEKINQVVTSAVNICTMVYVFVGFFGYVAFANKPFGGNILTSFAPSVVTNVMKLGFILSLAFSFPLVIFPCRQSLYSLLYREGYSLHESMSNYIPEGKFKAITMFIVFTSLVISILIPTIEVVLGLVGSTIGVLICLIFPVTCFICTTDKNTNERLVAKFVLILGIFIMVLGTYTNLRTLEKIDSPLIDHQPAKLNEIKAPRVLISEAPIPKLKSPVKNLNNTVLKVTGSPEIRHEPPQPIEIPEEPKKDNSDQIRDSLDDNHKETTSKPQQIIENIEAPKLNQQNPPKPIDVIKINDSNIPILQGKKTDDQVDIEAIKKDENEMKLQDKEKETKQKHHEEDDHQLLLETLKKQNQAQEQLVKQQEKLIQVIEKQQEKEKKETLEKEKLKAVKEIENIALKAIKKISEGDEDAKKIVSKDLENRVNEVIKKTPQNNAENVEGQKNKKEETIKINSDTLGDNKNEANSGHKKVVEETKLKLKEIIKDVNNIDAINPIVNEQKGKPIVSIMEKTKEDVKKTIESINNHQSMTDKTDQVANKKVKTITEAERIINKINPNKHETKENKIIEDTKQQMDEIVMDINSLAEKRNEKEEIRQNISELKNVKKIEPAIPAPLFLNLGLKTKENQVEIDQSKKVKNEETPKAIPVPVRLMNSSSNFTLNKPTKGTDPEKANENLRLDSNEVKFLRRDILVYSSPKRR